MEVMIYLNNKKTKKKLPNCVWNDKSIDVIIVMVRILIITREEVKAMYTFSCVFSISKTVLLHFITKGHTHFIS